MYCDRSGAKCRKVPRGRRFACGRRVTRPQLCERHACGLADVRIQIAGQDAAQFPDGGLGIPAR